MESSENWKYGPDRCFVALGLVPDGAHSVLKGTQRTLCTDVMYSKVLKGRYAGDGVRAWLTSGAWESRRAGRLSSSSPLLNNKIARPGSVPPSVAVSPRICYLPCLPCLYTPCTKELLRPTVGLLCLRQGLWIRTRKVLCCPRAGTRWRTFRTQRYSKGTQRRSTWSASKTEYTFDPP